MNRIGVIFLVCIAPAFALLLATLGAVTVATNPLGWFLLVVGLAYTTGTIIVYAIQKKQFWETQAGGNILNQEQGSLSFWLVAISLLLVFFAAPLEDLFQAPLLPQTLLMTIAGPLLVVFGTALFVWARRTLRLSYAGQIAVTDQQPLVQTGPYRVIRHPAYGGYLCIALGLGIGYSSLIAILLALVAFLPAVLVRIHVEEKILVSTFGDPYREYASHTWRLIPGIW